jgi:retron-type reverse transcriptase
MEKNIIIKRASELQDKGDLLHLLNELVKDELGGDKAFSFSMKQLSYYCNPNNIRGRYKHFTIPKKSGGTRDIAAPSRGLGNLLYYVNIILKAMYKPSDYTMGFTEGRSVVDNAWRHIDQNYVFNTDLENFFPSIAQARVWKRFQLKPFCFPQAIASILAGLCCIKVKNEDGTTKYVVPQGAPTSPLITNAICDSLDRKLSGLARRFNLHYTRYADDITFSSMHNVYQENGDFRQELKRIIENQGFKMNEKKTRLQKRGGHQEVTGLTVSTKVNVRTKYVAEIRNILHIWEKYGYNDAYQRFYPKYKQTKGYVKKGEPLMENVLYGKLQYLKMVKGDKDPLYMALQTRYDKLTCPTNAEANKSLDYLRSFSLSEFEKIVGEKISYVLSKEGRLYGKTSLKGEDIFVNISNAAKVQLVKEGIIHDAKLVASVRPFKGAIPVISEPGLYVVLTSRNGKRPFWMMTYYDPTATDIDMSNIPVSQLLDIWEKNGIEAAMNACEMGILDNTLKMDKHAVPVKKKKQNNSKIFSNARSLTEAYGADIEKVVSDVANNANGENDSSKGMEVEKKCVSSHNSQLDELDSFIDDNDIEDL